MKLSILIVKIQRDNKYCDLLLESIKQTISLDAEDYEIIVHSNDDVILQNSSAHATGLTNGYKKTKGEIVLILDPDTYFFAKGWDTELLADFEKENVVLCASVRCKMYEMPFFYRSHFLAIRDSFYRDLILNQQGFLPQVSNGRMINDMSYKITKFCLDNDKTFVHYKNSCDDDLEKYYRISGETIYNKQGKAFFHHMGRGATKPERLLDWIDFWENNKQ